MTIDLPALVYPARDEPGHSFTFSYDPHRSYHSSLALSCQAHIRCPTLPEPVNGLSLRLVVRKGGQNGRTQPGRITLGNAKSRLEQPGFVTATRVGGVQAIVAQLRNIGLGIPTIWKTCHDRYFTRA